MGRNVAWWWCPECGIVRQVEGENPRCEINGAGSAMERVSDALAEFIIAGDRRIGELEAEPEARRG